MLKSGEFTFAAFFRFLKYEAVFRNFSSDVFPL